MTKQRPHPDHIMSLENARKELPKYTPLAAKKYVDQRDDSEKFIEEVIIAPAIDYEFGNFMMFGRNIEDYKDLPVQIVGILRSDKTPPPHIHLADVQEYLLEL